MQAFLVEEEGGFEIGVWTGEEGGAGEEDSGFYFWLGIWNRRYGREGRDVCEVRVGFGREGCEGWGCCCVGSCS